MPRSSLDTLARRITEDVVDSWVSRVQDGRKEGVERLSEAISTLSRAGASVDGDPLERRLTSFLLEEEPRVRKAVAEVLGTTLSGQSRAVSDLTHYLLGYIARKPESGDLRLAFTPAPLRSPLSEYDPFCPAHFAGSRDVEVRAAVAKALGEIEPDAPEVIHTLVLCLGSGEPRVRGEAALALGKIAPPEMVKRSLAEGIAGHLAEEQDRLVERRLIQALGEIVPDTPGALEEMGADVVQALSSYIGSENRSVALDAIEKIAAKAPKEVEEALTEFIDTEHDYEIPAGTVSMQSPLTVRAGSAVLFHLNADRHEVLQKLTDLVTHGGAEVREVAASELERWDGRVPSEKVKTLLQRLEAEDPEVRKEAARMLEQVGRVAPNPSEVAGELAKRVGDESAKVRKAAVSALGGTDENTPDVFERLISALGDEDSEVRYAAAKSIGWLGVQSSAAIEALTQSLDEGGLEGEKAAEALGNIGACTARVVDGLMNLLEDDFEPAQNAAARALGKIAADATEETRDRIAEALTRLLVDLEWLERELEKKGIYGPNWAGELSEFDWEEAYRRLPSNHALMCAAAEALGNVGSRKKESMIALCLLACAYDRSDASNDIYDDLPHSPPYESSDVRAASRRALGEIQAENPLVVSSLALGCVDKDREAQFAAVGALLEIAPKRTGSVGQLANFLRWGIPTGGAASKVLRSGPWHLFGEEATPFPAKDGKENPAGQQVVRGTPLLGDLLFGKDSAPSADPLLLARWEHLARLSA